MKTKHTALVLTALFAALTAVGAFMKIPMPLLPITMQPVFSVLAGLLLGARYGTASQALYMLIGLSGIPIFASGGGIGYIFMPSFGFILGFVACAAVTGWVNDNKIGKERLTPFIAAIFGLVTLYIVGGGYMYLILTMVKHKPGINLTYIISTAVFPYIIKDFVLFMLAAAVSLKLKPALKKFYN